jgi:PhnB protein
MTKPIPDGYHSVTPTLMVKGAADAIEFYKKAFGATEMYRFLEKNGPRVMHAEIRIGDSIIMLGDIFPEYGHGDATVAGLHLYIPDVDAMFKQAIAAGATEVMPVADMFWGDRYGKLRDPFGQTWSLATHTRDLSPDEMKAAAEKAFAQQPNCG